MASNYRGDGNLITLTNCTAFSALNAGVLVCLCTTGSNANNLYTLGNAVAGQSATALMGYQFVGVLDQDIAAGAANPTVRTNGVFVLTLSSGSVSGDIIPGAPVWADSGNIVVTPAANTGDAAIGSIVGMATWGVTGADVDVKINPVIGNARYTIYCPSITGTQAAAIGYPKAVIA